MIARQLLITLLFSTIMALVVLKIDRYMNPPLRYATVDFSALVKDVTGDAMERALNGETVDAAAMAKKLEQEIAAAADELGVILLVRQAVVGNDLPDITQRIRSELKVQSVATKDLVIKK